MAYEQRSPPLAAPRPMGPRPKPPSRSPPRSPPLAFAPINTLPPRDANPYQSPPSAFRGTLGRGTLLHKGFFDLLGVAAPSWGRSTPSPWGISAASLNNDGELLGGPRYNDLPSSSPSLASRFRSGSPPANPPVKRVVQKAPATVAESRFVLPTASVAAQSTLSPPVMPRKPRKISKDQISAPSGFVHLVHASDAEQAEALLNRWGPDGVGKLGSQIWAQPIKQILRKQAAQRAIAEVVDARHSHMQVSESDSDDQDFGTLAEPGRILRVVNGMSTVTGTTSRTTEPLTSPPLTSPMSPLNPGQERESYFGITPNIADAIDTPLPTPSRTNALRVTASMEYIPLPDDDGNAHTGSISKVSTPMSVTSSRGWLNTLGGLSLLGTAPQLSSILGPAVHIPSTLTELMDTVQAPAPNTVTPTRDETVTGKDTATLNDTATENGTIRPLTARPRPPFEPSVMTLDRAASAKIYFENLYFPILRQPPSREQRRMALERDLAQMAHLSSAAKDEIRDRWRKNESEYLREKRQKVSAEAFKRVKVIGHGAFGVVSLVKEKRSGKLYAMKQLRKTDMLRKGQEGHVRAEREVLKAASLVPSLNGAEWIVKLHYSFQDQDNLYLILEYMGGGDLLNLLIERDVFEENFARFYIAEMILAIEQCHKQGFIHRDIKPDNFLFDPDGHIKLSDFGLATDLHWAHDTSYYEQQRKDLLRRHGIDLLDGTATGRGTKRMSKKDIETLMGGGKDGQGVFTWRDQNRRKLAYSVCGTNSYMSPEVIRGHGYTFSCDWWSLGVIMYECLYGFPPFVSNSRHVTRQMILNWRKSLKFPAQPRISREGVDLIQKLLCEPEDRIGSQAPSSINRPDSLVTQQRMSAFLANPSVDGAEQLKAHPWFRGIDWDNIHRVQAPFRPELRDPGDTRYFDDDIPAEPLAPANGAPPDATRDPALQDVIHGQRILESRKQLAFAGFTHKSPRVVTYPRVDSNMWTPPGESRGRPSTREPSVSRSRALSL